MLRLLAVLGSGIGTLAMFEKDSGMLSDICEMCGHAPVPAGPKQIVTFPNDQESLVIDTEEAHKAGALSPARRRMLRSKLDPPDLTGPPVPMTHLRVGVSILPPFIMWKDRMDHTLGFNGFSADLWMALTAEDQVKEQKNAKLGNMNDADDTGELSGVDLEQPEVPEESNKPLRGEGNSVDATGELQLNPFGPEEIIKAPGRTSPVVATEPEEESASDPGLDQPEPAPAPAKDVKGAVDVPAVDVPAVSTPEETRRRLLATSKATAWDYLVAGVEPLSKLTQELMPDSMERNMQKLENGEIDVIGTGLSINYRNLKDFKFSQSYWFSGVGLLVPVGPVEGQSSGMNYLHLIGRVAGLTGAMCVLLVIVGHIYWMLEKPDFDSREEDKAEGQPGKGYLSGVALSIWWATVTVTTVGYGDVSPQTRKGKFFSMIWIFMAVFIFASFTGNISAAMTAEAVNPVGIGSFSDLEGRTVGLVTGSYSAVYFKTKYPDVTAHMYPTAVDAQVGMLDGEVACLVGSNDVLTYMATKGAMWQSVKTTGPSVHKHPIAFAFGKHVPEEVVEYINYRLLRAQFNNGIDKLVQMYMTDGKA